MTPGILPHASVLTSNVHTRPPAIMGTSTLWQIVSALRIDVAQFPQVEVMVYCARHPGSGPHVNVSNSEGPRTIFERVMDSGGGNGSKCTDKENLHNS